MEKVGWDITVQLLFPGYLNKAGQSDWRTRTMNFNQSQLNQSREDRKQQLKPKILELFTVCIMWSDWPVLSDPGNRSCTVKAARCSNVHRWSILPVPNETPDYLSRFTDDDISKNLKDVCRGFAFAHQHIGREGKLSSQHIWREENRSTRRRTQP